VTFYYVRHGKDLNNLKMTEKLYGGYAVISCLILLLLTFCVLLIGSHFKDSSKKSAKTAASLGWQYHSEETSIWNSI
jgi:ABC-type spermidine/putrescine transport system permease subunit I